MMVHLTCVVRCVVWFAKVEAFDFQRCEGWMVTGTVRYTENVISLHRTAENCKGGDLECRTFIITVLERVLR